MDTHEWIRKALSMNIKLLSARFAEMERKLLDDVTAGDNGVGLRTPVIDFSLHTTGRITKSGTPISPSRISVINVESQELGVGQRGLSTKNQ